MILLCSCDRHNSWRYHDPSLKTQKSDYEALTTKPMVPNHHDLQQRKPLKTRKPYLEPEPSLPKSFNKKISLSVQNAIPLQDILMSLAQKIGANLIIDPNIKDHAKIHALNLPASNILRELCRHHGLRLRSSDQMIRIERDRPYVKNYDLQFLILARTNQNRVSIATDVFTTLEGGTRSDEDNGSNTNLTAETKIDFWQELQNTLTVMLTEFKPDETHLSEKSETTQARFTIHKQAGIISIYANDQQQRLIQEYLDRLQSSVERQVLIEAKILEVSLNDEFRSGINWNLVRSSYLLQAPLGNISTPGAIDESLPPVQNIFTVGGNARDLTGVINLLNRFGTVRTLSNPRLTVINNNPAVLKVARQRVYFKLNVTREYNYYKKKEEKQITSDVKTVPIGLMMYVHPSICEDGRIIMTLRPTISQVIREVADPAVSIASNNQQEAFVPEIHTKEIATDLLLNSGEVAIVGGLMQDESANEKNGVPELQDTPLIGGLFGGKDDANRVTELVMFIKATVINGDTCDRYASHSSVSDADKRTYEKYSRDPRPLEF